MVGRYGALAGLALGLVVLFGHGHDAEPTTLDVRPLGARSAAAGTSGALRGHRPVAAVRATVGEAFWHSTDLVAFMHDHAAAAYAGDGRAAYYLWEATLRCYVALELYRRHAERTDDVALCERMPSDDPFAALPPRDGGYPWRYWREAAIADGDAVALLQRGFENGATEQERRAGLQAAASSGDPEVYFWLGLTLPEFKESVGWQLAACELGYDCTMRNPRVAMGCVEAGDCASDTRLEDRLRDQVGAWAFSRAEARRDEILAELDAGRVPEVNAP